MKNRSRAELILAFIDRYVRVPEGPLVGQPMRLEPFQVDFIRAVYDNPAGTTCGILSLGRKNGKSALIAALMLAHIVGPEARRNSQVVSGARSRMQAAIVFNLATKMIHLSPVLAIIDEMGSVKGESDAFIEAIETAQGAYDDALELVISTQAASDADMLSVRIDDAIRSADPTIVAHVYAADPDAEIMDRSQWRKANPALGKFLSETEFEKKATQAARMPSLEAGFRNLRMNMRVNRFSPFLSPAVWRASSGEVDEAIFETGDVWGGLDLAETTDLCAFVLIARDADDVWHVKPTFWKPEKTLADHSDRDRQPYDRWARDGLIETTPGASVDYAFVAKKIAAICDGRKVRSIGFDRFRFKALAAHFEAIGVVLPFEAWGQGFVSMSPALDATETAFLNEQVRHGGHPVLTMCAANAVVVRDAAANRKLDKSKSTGRIDGMQALAMAFGVMANTQAPEPTPTYSMFILG